MVWNLCGLQETARGGLREISAPGRTLALLDEEFGASEELTLGGREGGPSAYWRRRFHFQLENEFPALTSRGGPREWSGVECLACGCAVPACGVAAAWRRRRGNVYSVSVYRVSVYSVYSV